MVFCMSQVKRTKDLAHRGAFARKAVSSDSPAGRPQVAGGLPITLTLPAP
jgi:hypothetical protein